MYIKSSYSKKMVCFIAYFFFSAFYIISFGQVQIKAGDMRVNLDESEGSIESIWIGGRMLPLKRNEALIEVKDVKTSEGFYPLIGKLIKSGNGYTLYGIIKKLGLTAKINFEVRDDVLFMDMDFKNETHHDRGLIISTIFRFIGDHFVWEGGLYDKVSTQKAKICRNNFIPISTLKDDNDMWGLAVAVPPDSPSLYDTYFKDGEFGIYYYIGITPITKNFPNQALLKEMVYSVNPKWGFRAALKKYYSSFPSYYNPRIKEVGLWGGWSYMEHSYPYPGDVKFLEAAGFGKVDSKDDSAILKVLNSQQVKNIIAKYKKLHMYIFPYTIVGQRQIYDLQDSTLPYNDDRELSSKVEYEKAINLLQSWNVNKVVKFQNPDNANSFDSVKQLKEIIYNSGIYNSEEHYTIVARNYTKKTLTFPLNPNPELYDDTEKMTISKYTFNNYIQPFLKTLPDISGIYFDSMGRWCNASDENGIS
jgi:hypothetical protein